MFIYVLVILWSFPYQELIHTGLTFFQIDAFDCDLLLPGHTVGGLNHSCSSTSCNTVRKRVKLKYHQKLNVKSAEPRGTGKDSSYKATMTLPHHKQSLTNVFRLNLQMYNSTVLSFKPRFSFLFLIRRLVSLIQMFNEPRLVQNALCPTKQQRLTKQISTCGSVLAGGYCVTEAQRSYCTPELFVSLKHCYTLPVY